MQRTAFKFFLFQETMELGVLQTLDHQNIHSLTFLFWSCVELSMEAKADFDKEDGVQGPPCDLNVLGTFTTILSLIYTPEMVV